MYICVDFDGTIVDHQYPVIGPPVPHALDWMKKWTEAGASLILFTMRSGTELDNAVSYLTENGITLFGINTNPTQIAWTSSPKAYGHIHVDDAAFGCPMITLPSFNRPCVDWTDLGPAILHQLNSLSLNWKSTGI